MRVIVLGAAAGGGFPQWNCACANCLRCRAGDPMARPATQCSVAISGDAGAWLLLNAAPDLRQQILATPALHPTAPRQSPLRAVALTGAEIDACAGLLCLRENHPFDLHAAPDTLAAIDANPMFAVLPPDRVRRRPVMPGERRDLGFGLALEAYAVPGKVPLYLEGDRPDLGSLADEALGFAVSDRRGRLCHFVPGCAQVTDELRARLRDADLLFFDGTLWRDDEMIRLGLGSKTGRRMGHVSIDGPNGALAALADVAVGRRIFIHLNNSNPALIEGTPERDAVQAAGWEVAFDGMEIVLS